MGWTTKVTALRFACLIASLCSALLAATAASADEAAPPEPSADAIELNWHTRYDVAWRQSKQQEKMLLILFTSNPPSRTQVAIEKLISDNIDVRTKLSHYVLARLPKNAQVVVDGQSTQLLDHGAFAEMHGFAGLSIIDLAHEVPEFYGRVVTAYPFMIGKYFRPNANHLPVLLDLPPGTITQRTMVWAVRIHPEHPASTTGEKNPVLVDAAKAQSQYQADIGVQGHHNWEGRFHRLRGRLGRNRTPVEVVAESWPSQTMIDSCIDCVASWRHSDGHWSAVRGRHRAYGYDIRRGANGIWYGTGIFSN
jgi:hypothetical protein